MCLLQQYNSTLWFITLWQLPFRCLIEYQLGCVQLPGHCMSSGNRNTQESHYLTQCSLVDRVNCHLQLLQRQKNSFLSAQHISCASLQQENNKHINMCTSRAWGRKHGGRSKSLLLRCEIPSFHETGNKRCKGQLR